MQQTHFDVVDLHNYEQKLPIFSTIAASRQK